MNFQLMGKTRSSAILEGEKYFFVTGRLDTASPPLVATDHSLSRSSSSSWCLGRIRSSFSFPLMSTPFCEGDAPGNRCSIASKDQNKYKLNTHFILINKCNI